MHETAFNLHERSLQCVGCGYDLRGLPAHGNCPECHTEIWRSRNGGRLKYADPFWMRRILWGHRIMFWSSAVLAIVVAVAIIGAIVLPLTFTSGPPPVGFDIAFAASILLFNIAIAGAGAGTILAAWPEPRERESQHCDWKRHLAQWGCAACATLLLLIEARRNIGLLWNLAGWWEIILLLALIPAWLISASMLLSRTAAQAHRLSRVNVGAQLGELLAGYAVMLVRAAVVITAFEMIVAMAINTQGTPFSNLLVAIALLACVTMAVPAILLSWSCLSVYNDWRRELSRDRATASPLRGAADSLLPN